MKNVIKNILALIYDLSFNKKFGKKYLYINLVFIIISVITAVIKANLTSFIVPFVIFIIYLLAYSFARVVKKYDLNNAYDKKTLTLLIKLISFILAGLFVATISLLGSFFALPLEYTFVGGYAFVSFLSLLYTLISVTAKDENKTFLKTAKELILGKIKNKYMRIIAGLLYISSLIIVVFSTIAIYLYKFLNSFLNVNKLE